MKQNKQVTRTRHGVDWCYVGCLSIRNGTGSGGGGGEIGRFDDYQTGAQAEISNALFNLSAPGITRLKRHQKRPAGWKPGGVTHKTSYHMDSHQSGPRRALSQPSGGRRVRPPDRRLPYNPGAPLASARRKSRMQDHRTGRVGICSAAGATAPRSEGATQAAANAESLRVETTLSWNPTNTSTRRLTQEPQQSARTHLPGSKPAQDLTWRGSATSARRRWLSRWRRSQPREQWRLS